MTGCSRNECGVCTRCGDASEASHDWNESERERPCFKRTECSRCGEVNETPDHDWTPTPGLTGDGTGIKLKCDRCGLEI